MSVHRSSPEHSEYDAWLIAHNAPIQTTAQLLHALASSEVRKEMYRRWRAERCNPITVYTDDIDRTMAGRIVDVLEERIDAGWRR